MVYLQIDLNGNQLHIYKPLYTVHIQLALPISLKDTDIAKKFKATNYGPPHLSPYYF